MIFSFIYDRLNEVWDEAMKKKVILAGPFSFTAIIRMIFQSYKNFKYQENLYDIIKLIKVFEQEYEKFNEALDTLGTRIQSVANQYQTVSVTRTKKLTGVVEKIKGDIFSLKEERVRGFDAVVFLAGLSNDPMAEFSPSLNFIYNGSSPSYLAYIAKRAGVPRFIYASSCSIYGNSVDKINTENSETISIYPYGISKWQGEFAVRKFSDSKFDVVCFRQGTLSGFSPRMRFDLMVNTMYMRAQTVGKITVDNPNIWRPLLSMSDAISAYVFAIESRKNISGVYNLSSGNFKVGEVAKRVQSYFLDHHNKKIAIEWNKKKSFRNYRVSTQKIKKKFDPYREPMK